MWTLEVVVRLKAAAMQRHELRQLLHEASKGGGAEEGMGLGSWGQVREGLLVQTLQHDLLGD